MASKRKVYTCPICGKHCLEYRKGDARVEETSCAPGHEWPPTWNLGHHVTAVHGTCPCGYNNNHYSEMGYHLLEALDDWANHKLMYQIANL